MEADLDRPSGAKRVMLAVLAGVPYNFGALGPFSGSTLVPSRYRRELRAGGPREILD